MEINSWLNYFTIISQYVISLESRQLPKTMRKITINNKKKDFVKIINAIF